MLLDVPDLDGLLAGSPACPGDPGAKCVGLEVQGETAAGENYGSTFLMVKVLFEDDAGHKTTVPAVCKRLPPTEYLRKTFNVDVSFPKEVNFYRCVVPALKALQTELGIPEAQRIQCFPRMFGARIGGGEDPSVVDDDAILVLEDLVAEGYRCGDRYAGLDLEHCRVAVRELARFHALGIALQRLQPAVFSSAAIQDTCAHFMHDRMQESDAELRQFQQNSLELVLDQVPEVLTLVDGEALRKAVLAPRDASRREPFATIIHCDFWVNNMMFAYGADGRPDRLKMVDFQLTEIGSPVRDLIFFIYSSADSEALAHVGDLIRDYYAELVSYAALHGVGGLDYGVFQKELSTTAPLELTHVFYMTCIIRAQKRIEKADSNSDDVFAKNLGISELARTRYLELVRDFVKRGWM